MDGIILVNKPQGWTSHDLVQKVRILLNIKKIGHTGTLDPLASGLMMLTIGKATKLLPFIVEHSKEYIAELQMGYSTDTLDITGEVRQQKEIIPYTRTDILNVFESMTGPQLQMPPMYSSKKVNGKKLYELARKNIHNREVEKRESAIIDSSNVDIDHILAIGRDLQNSDKWHGAQYDTVKLLCDTIERLRDNQKDEVMK